MSDPFGNWLESLRGKEADDWKARAEAAERQCRQLKTAWRSIEDVVYSGTVYENDAPSYYNGPMSDLFAALQAGRAALSDTAQETGDG